MSLVEREVYHLAKGKYVRNVVGSNDDTVPPQYHKSWIYAWEQVTEWSGKKYCCACGLENGVTDWDGNLHRVIGAHVVLGNDSDCGAGRAIDNGSDSLISGDRVFIAPVCDICNQNRLPLVMRFDVPIIHLWQYYYNENVGAFYDKDIGHLIGQCGNYVDTNEGARQEWNDLYEEYAKGGNHLDTWDGSYVNIAATSVPSMRSPISMIAVPSIASRGVMPPLQVGASHKRKRAEKINYYSEAAYEWDRSGG